MSVHDVTFDLDVLKEALDASIANADRHETDAVVIGRGAWVMARSLCDEYGKLADQLHRTERAEREWFVSYDVTARSVVLQKAGEDEQQITSDEALALRDDLLAAVVAENEHRVLRGEGSDAECPSMGHCKERAIAGCKSCGTWVGP